MTAYDYDRQCWIDGPEAATLYRKQLLEEKSVILSADGKRYLASIGLPLSVPQAIKAIDTELAKLS